MEQWPENLLNQLRVALRRRRQMEPEVTLLEDDERPLWDSTTKVVVGVSLFVLFAVAVYAFRVIFVPLIIGVIMAYILQPVVRLIRRATRLPRGVATALLYLALLALAVPVMVFMIPLAISRIIYVQRELISFARYLNTIGADTTIEVLGFTFGAQELVRQITSTLTEFITSVATDSISFVLDAARILLLVVFTFVIGFYLTRDAQGVVTWFRGIIPPSYQSDAEVLLAEFDRIWAAFFRGQVLLSLIVTVILTTLSAVLGLPQPILLGVWGGLLEFLPSIGNTIWGLTVIIVALAAGSTYLPLPNAIFALVVFGAYAAFAQLDINILIPTIIGRQVRLHPVVVILGVIIGATIGGVLGVALAAPTIASLRVVMRYVYANLCDLDPFPMIGAPSLPAEARAAEVDRLSIVIPTGSSPEPE